MNPEELRKIAVLSDLDNDALAQLAAVLEEKDHADGQVVFAEGDPGDGMYFILKGHIRIEKRVQDTGTARKTLTVLDAGDHFGEMALLDQKPRSASAIASGTSKTLRLSKAAFDEMQQKNAAIGMSVLFAMIRTSSDRIRRLSTQLVVYDEVGKAIGEAPDLQTLLDVILEQLVSATGADWGLLLLRSQFAEGLELRCQANLSLGPAQRQSVINGEGFIGIVLHDPQPQLVVGFGEGKPFNSCSKLGFETPGMLVSPIGVEGQLLGLILLGAQERTRFDLDALNLARGVARQAAQAILNARHREEEQARSRHSRQYVRF